MLNYNTLVIILVIILITIFLIAFIRKGKLWTQNEYYNCKKVGDGTYIRGSRQSRKPC